MKIINWQVKHFKELSVEELYSIMKLRVNVFINEQACFYSELDDVDKHPDALHLFTYDPHAKDTASDIIAYARILPINTRYQGAISIGRVVTDLSMRQQGLGHQLMHQAIHTCQQHFNNITIKISAQTQLENFYQQHSFFRITDNYLEDDIPHLGMQYNAHTQ